MHGIPFDHTIPFAALLPYCVECRGIFRARQRNTDCSSGTVRDWLLIEGTRTFSAAEGIFRDGQRGHSVIRRGDC